MTATSGTLLSSATTSTTAHTDIKMIAYVYCHLVFNSSTPIASDTAAVNTTRTLLLSLSASFNQTIQMENVTYEEISGTSYAVIISLRLNNVSMPEKSESANDTYSRIQNTINNMLNTVVSDFGQSPLTFQSANFMINSDFIEGHMEYIIQENESAGMISTTTVPMIPVSITPQVNIVGSALIYAYLVFNSSTPIASDTAAVNASRTLLLSLSANFYQTIQVENVTYEQISDTSYAVIISLRLNNVSMPEKSESANDTYNQIQNTINNMLNTVFSDFGQSLLTFQSANFMMNSDYIEGHMEYLIHENESAGMISTTTVTLFPALIKPQVNIVGSALIYAYLVFNSSTPITSETAAVNTTRTLLLSLSANFYETIQVENVTYEQSSETSYAVIISLRLSNVSMPELSESANDTYNQIQNTINNMLNTVFSEHGQTLLIFQYANFMTNSDQIEGLMEYTIQESETTTLFTTTATSMSTTEGFDTASATEAEPASTKITLLWSGASVPETTTVPQTVLGTVLIYIRLVFQTLGPIPSESAVLNAANTLLDSRVRTTLNNPVKIQNVTYERINSTAFAINFGYGISNVVMSSHFTLRNDTYILIESSVNKLLNMILSNNNTVPFTFGPLKFLDGTNEIQADVQYVFNESDLKSPSLFLEEIMKLSGLQPTTATITEITSNNTTTASAGGFPGWALAIIIPCGIAIILVPLWILLCCLLCGCCAALRRRWRRRQSYNVQYTTRNGLF
ncbi:uncharacterized threonine-rich GPI-anchored glycoprotein PJ4664.02-like isoform X3 [Denticeps clupeoides]|uniref:uncharacterized threonine-rich GPI-anchored glycoprotein PJ4664.02-like isoform X3 n=1 Tax=Denticeps clupeoides TaxID=299321 RepID=UPI0010A49CD8|nr:uncharacterized threonine-rich GPI-anchored glycoprotein PJ4664.02-like isoform X3 [Denticeps clupeoides]